MDEIKFLDVIAMQTITLNNYCNFSLLKGNSTFLEIISCRDTNHCKKVFYLDLFGLGPVWISIHWDMNVSLYVYLNCYISNLYRDLTP